MDNTAKPQRRSTKDRHDLFIAEYLKDRNGTQAAIRAGYSPKSAKAQASNLLSHPNIKVKLDALVPKANAERMKSAEDFKEMLIDAITLDLTELITMGRRGCELKEFQEIEPRLRRLITEFTNVSGKTGWRVNFKVFSKEKAADILAKVFGVDKGITMNVAGNVTISNLADKYLD